MLQEFSRRSFFRLLVIFRWASLAPAIIMFRSPASREALIEPLVLVLIAVLVNLFVTLNVRRLNALIRNRPWVLMIDVVYSVGLLLLGGGGAGPFYLHSLSPLMAAAFFFQVGGGVLASAFYSALYIGVARFVHDPAGPFTDGSRWISLFAGVWLIPAVMGELSRISHELEAANRKATDARAELARQNDGLSEAHQRLQTIHDLTRLLQAAPDVRSMQEQVLNTLAQSLKYPRALLGLVKPGTQLLHAWKGLVAGQFDADPALAAQPGLALDHPDYPLVKQILASGKPTMVHPPGEDALHPGLSTWAGGDRLLLTPLIFHEQAVGMLVIPLADGESLIEGEKYMLVRTLANQAATSLGTTMLCVERAQDLAVEQERNRIAREIHDTVSQSLFGMVYSLDACIRMLPESGEVVKNELIELQSLANYTREQVRHSIFDLWPSSLTLDIFKADLNHYVSHCFRLKPFVIEYDVGEGFNELSPAIRRNMYRITQEALTNVLHHAGVDRASVNMEIDAERLDLSVTDAGIGFDVEHALSREYNREHFGLHGIRERVHALGGVCKITSKSGEGSRIWARIPLKTGKGGALEQ